MLFVGTVILSIAFIIITTKSLVEIDNLKIDHNVSLGRWQYAVLPLVLGGLLALSALHARLTLNDMKNAEVQVVEQKMSHKTNSSPTILINYYND